MNHLLKEFMKNVPHRTELKRGMILHFWPEVVGERIQNVTRNVRFEESKLIVKVENEAWRHEIHANRFSIKKKLNNKVGSNVVRDIIVRV